MTRSIAIACDTTLALNVPVDLSIKKHNGAAAVFHLFSPNFRVAIFADATAHLVQRSIEQRHLSLQSEEAREERDLYAPAVAAIGAASAV